MCLWKQGFAGKLKMLLSTGRENQTHAPSFVLTLELLVVIV